MKVIKVVCLYSAINLGFIACSDDDKDKAKTPAEETGKNYDFIATITETDKPTVCLEVKAETNESRISYQTTLTARLKGQAATKKVAFKNVNTASCPATAENNVPQSAKCESTDETKKYLNSTVVKEAASSQEELALTKATKISYVYGEDTQFLLQVKTECEKIKSKWTEL